MGRWMESIKKNGEVFSEYTPYLLILCTRYLPNKIQTEFPLLSGLDLDSDHWIDETQTLDNKEVALLHLEFTRVRRLSKMEEFISGVDNKKFTKFWKGDERDETEFQEELNSTEAFLLNAMNHQLEVKISL